MRIRKSTWLILITLVLVIVALVAFELRKNMAIKAAQAAQQPILPDWTADQVIKISIKYGQDKINLQFLRDKSNNWVYVERQSNAMPQDEINAALTELFALTPTKRLDQNTPADQLGLTPPVASFDVISISGEETTVKIGDAVPLQGGYYLQVDNQTPVTVPYNDVIQILDTLYLKVVPATRATPLVPSGSSTSSTEVAPMPFQNP